MSVQEKRRSQEGEERSLQVPKKSSLKEKNKNLMSHKTKEKRRKSEQKKGKDVKYVCKKGDVESVLALKNYLLLIILNRLFETTGR